mmetsp:Transcript_10944/g.27629  ORF Transcript_10944/g.27629 Transcript_10944/m.27629 type:complete len:817 (-) Transcript_10944:95-2545(-)
MNFDEGAVFFSNQRYTADDEENVERGHVAQQRFATFLRSFRDDEGDTFVYRDQLLRNKDKVRVKLEHVRQFDDELGDLLVNRPAEYLALLESAASAVLLSLQATAEEGEDAGAAQHQEVQVFLYSDSPFGPKTLRELSSEHVSKLVTISGIVTAAGKPRAKATHVSLQCQNCKNTKIIACKPGLAGVNLPRRCELQQMEGAEPCPLDPFVVLPDSSKYVDQQTLKLQESPEDIPTGELPRNILLVVDRHLVQKIVPGTRVTTIGIFSIMQAKQGRGESVAIRQPYLRVVGLEEDSDSGSRSTPTFTLEEEQNFRDFASQSDCLDRLFGSIAPSIFGSPDIKRAISCLLFGGSRKRLPDGTRIRGDINVLMLGDPSTAKSQFLKFVEQTAPISVYTSGKGSSAAGLTASVIRDATSGEFYLEGGAMVLADGGVVCIDEFDKMGDNDRVAIHEVMEQQTVTISKAGIHTSLNARCSVVAAANPIMGTYDHNATITKNISLPASLLSRFDLLFIVLDQMTARHDRDLSEHVLRMHRYRRPGDDGTSAGLFNERKEDQRDEEENEEDDAMIPVFTKYNRLLHGPRTTGHKDLLSTDFLKLFVAYAKRRNPALTPEASEQIVNNYVEMRQDATNKTIPITVRALETMIRLSTAHAKLKLKAEVTTEDVEVAFDLMQYALYARDCDKYDKAHRAEQQPAAKRQRRAQDQSTSQPAAPQLTEGATAPAEAEEGAMAAAAGPSSSAGEAAADASAVALTSAEFDRVLAAYTTLSMQDEYASTVQLSDIRNLCQDMTDAQILEAVNRLKDQNKCGPIDGEEIYKI